MRWPWNFSRVGAGFWRGKDGVEMVCYWWAGRGDNAGVRDVSARMQTQPKFGLEMGHNGPQNGHRSASLGRGFCADKNAYGRT